MTLIGVSPIIVLVLTNWCYLIMSCHYKSSLLTRYRLLFWLSILVRLTHCLLINYRVRELPPGFMDNTSLRFPYVNRLTHVNSSYDILPLVISSPLPSTSAITWYVLLHLTQRVFHGGDHWLTRNWPLHVIPIEGISLDVI